MFTMIFTRMNINFFFKFKFNLKKITNIIINRELTMMDETLPI